jgi:CubicO group peptidase (beta-lactamase class C family)
MARPLECAAGWRGRELLAERWRDGLVSPRRFEIGDPFFNGAGIWWSLGLCADPVGFGLSLSSRAIGHTGERSSVVFSDLTTGITISFLSNGLVSRSADNARKRNLIRAVYTDLHLY